MKRIILILIISTILSSCEKDINIRNYIVGKRWEVTEMKYKNVDVEPLLVFSAFNFEADGSCKVPLIKEGDEYLNEEKRKAIWSMSEEKLLIINSPIDYIGGNYKICINKDIPNKSVYMTLKSNNLEVKAYRILGQGFKDPIPNLCK